tara:strand:+ start:181 stop:564 length:384 start_codon:yes stop_codon:yes gene_type:complete
MVEATFILDAATIGLIVCILAQRYRSEQNVTDRIDDITEGLALMANELLSRTEDLKNLKDFMPDISLVNQNPLASLAEFLKAIRGDLNSDGFNSPPRGSAGRFEAIQDGTTAKETYEETGETIDLTD